MGLPSCAPCLFALVSREVILYYFGGICKRFFYCFESGVAVVPVTGWPATGGAWVLVGGWVQGGVSGWFAPWQFFELPSL